MSDGDALLRAICEHPDEDTPRLVYADWLDENGDPVWAAFIRLQCRLERMAEDDPGRANLARAAGELVKIHGRRWIAALGPGVSHPEREFGPASAFRRGFVEALGMTAAGFVRRAGTLVCRTPLRRVVLRGTAGRADRLAGCRPLVRLAELDLRHNRLSDQDAAALAASPYLPGMTRLDVSCNWIGEPGALALVECLAAHPLTEVVFSGNRVGPAGAVALARSPALAARTALLLGHNGIGDAATATLLDSPHLGGLVRLDLDGNEVGERAVAALVARPRPALTELRLGDNDLGNHEARVLAGTASLAGVRVLSLRENQIGDPGAAGLTGGRAFPKLRWLDLSENRIGDDGAVALARSATFPELRTLDLSRNRIGDAGALEFLKRRPAGLEELNLVGTRISLDAARALRSAADGLRLRVRLNHHDLIREVDEDDIDEPDEVFFDGPR